MTQAQDHRSTDIAALFVLSTASLLYELLLMRIFSVLMWYHFASLAIGVALLGLGAGGLAVGLAPGLGTRRRWGFDALVFAGGAATVLGLLVAIHTMPELARSTLAPFHQPFYKPFARPETTQLGWPLAGRLLILALVTGWPFFFVGAAVTGALRARAPRIHTAYAATFLGSATGCVAFPLVLWLLSAPAALGAAATLGCVAAASFFVSKRGKVVACVLAAAGLAVTGWIQWSGAAEIPFARGRYEPELLAVRWNAMSRVAAYPLPPGDESRPFGLSRHYRGDKPRQIGLVVDDSGYTNLYDGAVSAANPEYFRANVVALPYHLRPRARALLFGPGGGKDIWIARSFAGSTVQAVEINPQVVELADETFAAFTGSPYSLDGVEYVVSDGRRFAATDTQTYDVIGASAVFGRQPPAAGAFTLSEDLLHTVEAFEDYWARLTDRGILSITRFAYERRALRLVALSRALLEKEGVADVGAHLRVVTDRGLANVMVSKGPFTAEDDEKLAELVRRYDFQFLYPQPAGESPSTLSKIVDAPEPGAVLAALDYDLTPPTDDRPFFYYTVRPGDFARGHLPGRAGFDDRGAEILRAAFGVLALLAFGALILPALVLRGLPRGGFGVKATLSPLVYFGAVGLGYMALEIGAMKRLMLFLGHPVFAVSATLFAFLVGSGLGALVSARVVTRRSRLLFWLAAGAALGLWQAFATPHILTPAMTLSLPLRCLAAAAVTLPLAFVLGMPFPAGMAHLGGRAQTLLPWAWAVNGAASVVGSLGAVLLAMNLGYTATLCVGAGCYFVALAAAFSLDPRPASGGE